MSPHTAGEVLLKIFTDLYVHRENGIRANQDVERRYYVLGRGDKILQNLTVIGRSLSDESGNKFIVPKGGCRHSPKD